MVTQRQRRQERAANRIKLRADTFAAANGHCQWPDCDNPATELAHITSSGAGGSRFRDELANVFAACPDHARISDGLAPPGGGITERNAEYEKVPGARPRSRSSYGGTDGWRTRDVMEALREHLNQTRI